ncbi:DMT family transporter [Pseudorhodoplanes sp.]|uniref:DMT family transporter n=1 Tax=Pseudorhodoplanes sp. TaxID=1934341 RepID=UPI002CA0F78F|nr:DMT family transporter [Pseudorhodoplanes sp.]HWV53273.1 DMT family transporter [Pseudorhodoplanes sp.]
MSLPATSLADRRREGAALAALVLGAIAMGASPLFVRMADVGPFASAFWRTALALPFLAIWALTEKAAAPRPVTSNRAVWLSGVLFAGDLFFWHLAILATTVANATFLATTAPLFVVAGAWFLLGERIQQRGIAGLALCLIGGAALVGHSYGFAPERLTGDFYGIVTAVFFAGYMLALRAARREVPTGTLSFISAAITTVILFVVAYAYEPRLLPQSAHGWTVLVALALISQVAGQGLLAFALGTLPAPFSSLVIFLEAVAAALFAWIILHEALAPMQWLGGILILAGIWIARPRNTAAGSLP